MKKLTRADLARDIATLHHEALNQSFLARLGLPFLCYLYESMMASDSHHVLVEYSEGNLVGFVSGGVGLGPVYRSLLSNPIKLTKVLLISLKSPSLLYGIGEILASSFRTKFVTEETYTIDLPEAELYSIAVHKSVRGGRVAADLYVLLCKAFINDGTSQFKILVGKDLSHAQSFYEKMGARKSMEVELHSKSLSVVYLHDLDGAKNVETI